jgi:preprotein translocase subunit SecB
MQIFEDLRDQNLEDNGAVDIFFFARDLIDELVNNYGFKRLKTEPSIMIDFHYIGEPLNEMVRQLSFY